MSQVPRSSDDDAKLLAHTNASHWAHALTWQIGRLREARQAVLAAFEIAKASGDFGYAYHEPWHELHAEVHFTVVAARQLLRSLRAFDGDDRLPQNLTNEAVRAVRDALEHWDDPDGWATRRIVALGGDPLDHQWSRSGPGLIAKLVPDEALMTWAAAATTDLRKGWAANW